MRIGISTSVIQRARTGIGQYVLSLLRALLPSAKQHQFNLFVLEEDLPLFEFVRGKMEVISVPEKFRPPGRDMVWHQARLPALVHEHSLDVLHVPSYRRLLWPQPCALVATIHDLAPFHVPGKYDRMRMFYGRVVVRRLVRRQTEIIAVSKSTAADIVRFFGLSGENVTVIHFGLDHERFFPGPRESASTEALRRWNLRGPFFLYVARLEHPAKNHVRLISAFNEFKSAAQSDWHMVLAGADWHGAEVVHDAIKRSPFSAHIHVLGFVPSGALPDLYRAADVFVYPSLYEGFGMPPIEAMACGCPVISSARGGLEEVLRDAAAIVDPEDTHSVARALRALASDHVLRDRLRAAGLAQAARFDWSRTAAETLKVYERAANRTGKISSARASTT